jgi:hypothetical protein
MNLNGQLALSHYDANVFVFAGAKRPVNGQTSGNCQLSCSSRPCGQGHFRLERSLRGRSTKSEDRLQISLFTRLNAVEAELRAMKDLLADLKVNEDALRRDRDEWRWRAERLLADRERGALWRWGRRADAALDIFGAILLKLTIDVRTRLAKAWASRNELRRHALARLSQANQLIADRQDGRTARLARKTTQPVGRGSSL